MKIGITQKDDPAHKAVCTFASRYYYNRHEIHITEFPDVFAYAYHKKIIGCFGLSYGTNTKLLPTEWYIPKKILQEKLTDPYNFSKKKLCELGTRVVDKSKITTKTNCGEISLALATSLLHHACSRNFTYGIFTGDRTVRLLSRALHIPLHEFGVPDLSKRSAKYRKKWDAYFNGAQRYCYGINMPSTNDTYIKMQKTLSTSGFYFLETKEFQLKVA